MLFSGEDGLFYRINNYLLLLDLEKWISIGDWIGKMDEVELNVNIFSLFIFL
jgi:hypothetical protein